MCTGLTSCPSYFTYSIAHAWIISKTSYSHILRKKNLVSFHLWWTEIVLKYEKIVFEVKHFIPSAISSSGNICDIKLRIAEILFAFVSSESFSSGNSVPDVSSFLVWLCESWLLKTEKKFDQMQLRQIHEIK